MTRAFSLSFLTYLDLPPIEAVRIAAATGYDFVGLRLLPAYPNGLAFPLMHEPKKLAETCAALKENGIGVFDIEMIRIGPDFQAERYDRFFEAAAALGAKAILVAGDDHDETRLTVSYVRLCERAAPYCLSMDLEFMPQSAVKDAKAAMRVLTSADQPNSAIIVDALHVSRSRTPIVDIASIPARWLNYAQICDGPAEIPTSVEELHLAARQNRLLPGDGAIDLKSLFEVLPRSLPVAIEVPNVAGIVAMGAEAWARLALERSRRMLNAIEAQGLSI